MKNKAVGSVHWSFWLIGTVALIWNVLGVANYFAQMNTDVVAAMAESHRAIIETRPVWATGAFALAVFAGALGCLVLLFRRSAAFYLFVVSLLGVIVTMIHTLGVVGSTTQFNAFEIVMMILLPLVVAAFLIWYAKQAESKGWVG